MLYLRKTYMRLALKLFRGEPAISGFDWNFSLPTPHPHPFQRMWVRSSIAFYGNFNLDMGRSPGFGSAPSDYSALLRLGFPSAPDLIVLNLARKRNSPDRSTKSTRFISYGCSTACKHMVSGSFSLPSRGPFHLSFTVLCSIGH